LFDIEDPKGGKEGIVIKRGR